MTTPPDRDAAVERLLKSRRMDPSAAAAGVCLDAGTLAAWTDGRLSHDERAAAEVHAAGCARCQALLAAMVRTQPVALREAVRGRAWTLVRWALPVSAAAAAALWFAVERSAPSAPSTYERAQTAASAAATPGAPPAPADAPAGSGPAEPELRAEARPRTRTAGQREARKQVAPPDRNAPADRKTAPNAAAVPPPAAPLQDRASLPQPPAAPPAPPPAAPPPESTATPQAPVVAPSRDHAEKAAPRSAAAEPAAVGGVAETVQIKRADAATARSRFRGARATESAAPGPLPSWTEVPSPDPLVRWRFSAEGEVEHSSDGGVSWTRQPFSRAGMLVAGTAPSASVCWLAGPRGVVLRFTTARGWQRFSIPYSPDIVSIHAADAENATVVLASGRRLSTTDGGANWR